MRSRTEALPLGAPAHPDARHRSTLGLLLVWFALAAALTYGTKATSQEKPKGFSATTLTRGALA